MTVMTLIFNIIQDYGVFPYFLRYYRAKGVTRFLCGVYRGWENPNMPDICQKLNGYPHEVVCSYHEEFNGERDAESQDLMRKSVLDAEDWYIIADVDEFHHHSCFHSFPEIQRAAELEGADYVASVLVDRLPKSGRLGKLDLEQSLDEQFPFASSFTRVVLGSCVDKVAIAKGHVPVAPGHHYALGKRASFCCSTHHFKWHGEDLVDRTLQRGLALSRQEAYYSKESLNLVAFHRKCFGKLDFTDSSLEIKLAEKIGV